MHKQCVYNEGQLLRFRRAESVLHYYLYIFM